MMHYVGHHINSLLEHISSRPVAQSAFIGGFVVLVILVSDYLNNQRKRWSLGGVPIVGDVPHLLRRIRTKPIDYRALFQSGYETV
jgi:hypothetical protein